MRRGKRCASINLVHQEDQKKTNHISNHLCKQHKKYSNILMKWSSTRVKGLIMGEENLYWNKNSKKNKMFKIHIIVMKKDIIVRTLLDLMGIISSWMKTVKIESFSRK